MYVNGKENHDCEQKLVRLPRCRNIGPARIDRRGIHTLSLSGLNRAQAALTFW